MWTKLMSLFAVALLVMSALPLAIAQSEGNRPEEAPRIAAQMDERLEEAEEPRAKIQARLAEQRQRMRERQENFVERKEALQARLEERREDMTKSRIEQAEERYEETRVRYAEARQQYQEVKKKVQQARQRFAGCADDASAECQRVNEEMREHGKPFLLRSADLVLEALERTRMRIEASEEMDTATKADLLTRLADKRAEIEDARAVIEELDEEATPEEIREAAKTIREAWQESRYVLLLGAGHVVNAQLGNIIHRTERLSERIHRTRDRLASQGKEVAALDEQLDIFDQKLGLANQEWQTAVDLYTDAAPGQMDAVAKEARQHVQRAKELLAEVRDALRTIVNEIKRQEGSELRIENGENSDDGTPEQGSGDA